MKGYILLNTERYDDALLYLQEAENKGFARDILNNIGVAQFHLGNLEEASKCFAAAADESDTENRSLYNLAVTSFCLKDYAKTEELLLRLIEAINNEFMDAVCSYEVASIYAALKNYQKATELILELGIDGIDLSDWPELAYSIFKTSPIMFDECIDKLIIERRDWICELENDHEDWEEWSTEEKFERIEELQLEIKVRQNLRSIFDKKKPEVRLTIMEEHCGCLLFGCFMHKNPFDDL
jgi:tetratricopeptide (TPR) repeat protein